MDERNVGENVSGKTTNVGHPQLKVWKYPLPGDTVLPMLHRVVIDTENGGLVRFQNEARFSQRNT